jgi:hypothetical protein
MMPYRNTRRAFLAGVGGAFALKILLRNFEAMAQGATSPPRFLLTHWPVGTVKYLFVPQGSGTITQFSRILEPFNAAGLKDDMTLIWGLRDVGQASGGGGHEAGTPFATTGANSPGTRRNGGEGDDACAGGPSWDQILLTEVADDATTGAVSLQRPGIGYANAICDERIDSQETSTRCLSYGYQTQNVESVNPGGTITENVPLLPELSPVQLYMKVFSGFMPGGDTPSNQEAIRRALIQRRSVLDYCKSELAHLKTIAPAAEAQKIDIHAEVCRKMEAQLSDLINGNVTTPSGCVVPDTSGPEWQLEGGSGSRNDYGRPTATVADDETHHQIGLLHAKVLLSAFQCDIIRVATFQWSPGTNHVSFKGLYPGEPNTIYMHHPLSHRNNGKPRSETFDGPSSDPAVQGVTEFLANAHAWYNEKTAEVINMFKNAEDAFGNSLLDYTVIPHVTEVAEQGHSRSPKAAFIFGGRALGMQLGKYLNFESQPRAHVDLWASIAQAYLRTSDPMSRLGHLSFGTTPRVIDGLWVPPA